MNCCWHDNKGISMSCNRTFPWVCPGKDYLWVVFSKTHPRECPGKDNPRVIFSWTYPRECLLQDTPGKTNQE